ncbi:UNVERIFIED_CONTAM: AP2-like ethylene-responsive transcription factor AIL6 [Sesamum calycinum]|uniref:AP2-like ethylene-responsive transcription factor AIL6 n=1 Tax=Sesamum calycinum TaxID=2727403 RepID=A0AAW2SV25_9LAMI
MAPDNNWLSFSLSSMEMLNPSSQPAAAMLHSTSADSHHFYSFADNFYANGWATQKPQAMYGEAENHQVYMQPPPKLEDFFAGGDSTETQDSSLTHIYDHQTAGGGAAFFGNGEHQDLKTFTGFQAFSANSGSEVNDSAFAGQTQSPVESGSELVGILSAPLRLARLLMLCLSALITVALLCALRTITTQPLFLLILRVARKSLILSDKEPPFTEGLRDTDGQGDTKRIYGITAVEGRAKQEKGVKALMVGWGGGGGFLGSVGSGYDKEDKAARAYDLAALKYWGPTATTNFPISNYTKELEEMKHVTKQEFIASLRRKSSGFSRGASIYRGVTRHHQQGRWQARIGRVAGNKDLYLGTFATEEEAAEAYDIAAIKFRGVNAVTNFEMSRYDVEAIAKSPLPIGGTAKRLKLSLEAEEKLPLSTALQTPCSSNSSSSISFSAIQPASTIPCGVPYDTTAPFYHHNLFHHLNTGNLAASVDNSGPVSSMVTSVNLMPSPPEFFIWPHQSY